MQYWEMTLTYRVKPQVTGIKITTDCLQMIHFPSWVAHSHFDLSKLLAAAQPTIY